MDKLLEWEDERIQRLLRITDQEDCIVALLGASEQVGEKLFKNMPKGVSDYIKRRMKRPGPPPMAPEIGQCH